jgi:Asp/Glu/hydantoin racemase
MKKVYIVHTSLVSHAELNALFAELIPEAKVFNIVDDSLLADAMANGGITEKIVGRMCKYYEGAAANGADLIFNQCSSVGEAADIAAKLVAIPVVKVDEAMAEKAVALGKRIAVVATVKSTMKPSCNLVRAKAALAGKSVEVVEYLVDGALDVLMKENNRAKHNALVLAAVKKAEAECDVIVLAQGSMTVLLPELTDIQKPVLTSPRIGVEKARAVLMQGALR